LPKYQGVASDKATTMGHIQRRHLTESIINVPDFELMNNANDVLEPLLEKLKTNSLQIQSLTQTRDTLLPKLMSGQLQVSELGLERFQDFRISEKSAILKSTNPKNHNSDKKC
jgi:type I restriction enzyme S subunit